MKESLIFSFLLVLGMIFSQTAGSAQIRITSGEYGEGNAIHGEQSGQPSMSTGRVERSHDGGQSFITRGFQQLANPMDKDQGRTELDRYLGSTGNADLKIGDITEKGENFEADIITKNASLLDKILVNRHTGKMRSEY